MRQAFGCVVHRLLFKSTPFLVSLILLGRTGYLEVCNFISTSGACVDFLLLLISYSSTGKEETLQNFLLKFIDT